MEKPQSEITMNDVVAKRQYFQIKYMFNLKKVFSEDLYLPDQWKTYKIYSSEQTEKFISDVYNNLDYIDKNFRKYNISTIDDYINILKVVSEYRFALFLDDEGSCCSNDLNAKNNFLYDTIPLLYKWFNDVQRFKVITLLTFEMRDEKYCRNIMNQLESWERNFSNLVFKKI